MRALAPETRQSEYCWSLAPLVREHRAWVEAMARRHLGDPALAEEVAQDVFLRLARLPRPPAEAAALRAWLLRTVWFLSANARRKAARRRSVEALAAREFGGETGMNPPPSPEELPLEELAAALDTLPDLERVMVLEHYFEGREHGEIGTRHRLSGEAARKRIARALVRLRSHLVRLGVAVLPSVSIAAVLGVGETSRGALVKAALTKSLSSSPAKTAVLTVMACAAVAVPLVVSQQRRIQDLQNRPQQQQQQVGPETVKADFRGAGLPDSPWMDAESTGGWTPRSFNAEGFPNVPPIAQWILDTLPVLAAAAVRGGSREPLNLRLSITMNQSVSGLMPPRKAGLIDLERVVREYQSSS
ncbi:MAG: RNA polymerase sigma factor, partial [Verrucomicrobiaceae bacterium]